MHTRNVMAALRGEFDFANSAHLIATFGDEPLDVCADPNTGVKTRFTLERMVGLAESREFLSAVKNEKKINAAYCRQLLDAIHECTAGLDPDDAEYLICDMGRFTGLCYDIGRTAVPYNRLYAMMDESFKEAVAIAAATMTIWSVPRIRARVLLLSLYLFGELKKVEHARSAWNAVDAGFAVLKSLAVIGDGILQKELRDMDDKVKRAERAPDEDE